MVFDKFESHLGNKNEGLKLASVNDRFLAFVFDVLIFAPIFSLFLSQVSKHIELMYYTAAGSFEFMALIGVCALMVCVLTILFQTMFLLLFGGTPGKLFMKLRVISIHGEKLTFSQCLARSTVWVLEFLLLGLPLLEVVSHSLRRSLHDRVADTVVTTLKLCGDTGPHFLESQFVRQMLLAVFLMVITWGIFFTGSVYRMALSGDFKKNELAEKKYLCQMVSDRVTDEDNRIDIAAALFQADIMPSDCLAAEADFAMWTLSEEKKAWSYYAKMLLSSDNEETRTAYQGKVCSLDAGLCDLANNDLEKVAENSKLVNSHIYAVLRTQQDLYNADVPALKKNLETLEGFNGFKDYAQAVKIKLFWLEQKQEKALGAFDTVALYMSNAQAQKISSWLCHQEMDQGCENKVYTSCSALKKLSKGNAIDDIGAAFALVRDSQCKKTPLNYSQVEKVFAKDKMAMKLLRAIDSKSEMPSDMRKANLIEIATANIDQENIYSQIASQYVFNHELSRKDVASLALYLEKSSTQNDVWKKIFSNTIQTAMKINAKEELKHLVGLVKFESLSNGSSDFKEQMALAFYQVEDYKKSWSLLKSDSVAARRNPASENLVSIIRKELAKKFEGQ